MKFKKIAVLILAALMILPVFCVSTRAADEDDDETIAKYLSTQYTDQLKKVETMELMYSSDEYGYAMYFDKKSGEFALKNLKTGEFVFSNPYDIAVNTKMHNEHKYECHTCRCFPFPQHLNEIVSHTILYELNR